MRAVIFDCDGVLADTERHGHLPAFNQTFREFGLPLQWSEDEYGHKLKIGGGKERMASMFTPEFVAFAGLPVDLDAQKQLIADLHRRKTAIYKEMIADGRLPGRPGVRRLAGELAEAGWMLGVASTSAEEAVRAVIEHVVGPELAACFVVLAGDVVSRKKPAPDIYLLALEALGIFANEGLAVEDSRNGLVAAHKAGLRTLVTVSSYTTKEDMSEALLVVSDLGEPDVPMKILANRSVARPTTHIAVSDLESLLRSF